MIVFDVEQIRDGIGPGKVRCTGETAANGTFTLVADKVGRSFIVASHIQEVYTSQCTER